MLRGNKIIDNVFTSDAITHTAALLTQAQNASLTRDGTLTTVEDDLSLERAIRSYKR